LTQEQAISVAIKHTEDKGARYHSFYRQPVGFGGDRASVVVDHPGSGEQSRVLVDLQTGSAGDLLGRIYLATSSRNPHHEATLQLLREHYEVYDFKSHPPGTEADHLFQLNVSAMRASALCVLIEPAGISAHLELGWFVGRCRPTIVYSPDEPLDELMIKMCTGVARTEGRMLQIVGHALRREQARRLFSRSDGAAP